MVVGFSVKCGKPIMTQAARSGVDVYLEGVIYRLIEEVTNRVSALLPPIIETRTLGEGAVSQLFDIKMKNGKTIKVAGCRVNNGIFSKTEKIKVFRRGVEVFQGAHDNRQPRCDPPDAQQLTLLTICARSTGAISSLKYVKDDVNEVRKGSDCGLQLEGFEGFEPGDTLQVRLPGDFGRRPLETQLRLLTSTHLPSVVHQTGQQASNSLMTFWLTLVSFISELRLERRRPSALTSLSDCHVRRALRAIPVQP